MRRRHSLSGRLLLLFLVAAVLLVIVVRAGFRFGVEGSLRELAGPHLDEYLQHLLAEVGNPPTSEGAARLTQRLPVHIHLLGGERWSSAGEPPRSQPRTSTARVLADGTRVELERGRDGLVIRARRGDVTVVLVPQGFLRAETVPIAIVLTIAGVLVVLVLVHHAIRRLFRPIETIRAGIAAIGAGDLDHRLNIHRRDELGDLAASINAMADEIRDMLEAKRHLLLAISHELRSPLTRARINAELLDDSPARRSLLKDLGELETLLGELLEAERLRGLHAALTREAIDPSELLRDLVDGSFLTCDVRLDLDPSGTWLSLDPVRIRLLVRNLLTNAIRHTPQQGPPPTLSSHVDPAGWTLAVADSGPGVAAEEIGRLTDPFYRGDRSRQRGTGGVGLGLYLSRAIAEAHGGTLTVESGTGKGTSVLVRIPMAEEDE
jgi:signal transduction histidine kinase